MTAAVIEQARAQGRTLLNEVEAKQLLREAGIPVVETRLAKTKDEAVSIAGELGYPVALKIVSPQITHKSDAGGVKLGLTSADGVSSAYDDIVAAAKRAEPNAAIDGVSVQRMAKPGVEVIAGMTTDAQFGPVLMFGLGGVLVEVLKDVAFRVVPITKRDASQMIRELQGFPLLEGYRGQEPADLDALQDILLKLSSFAQAHPELDELDLNPVFAYPDGAIAVDARITLKDVP
ncbi:MAG: acetate--CoA ligase family protein [Dehalococcoidia bacterium]